MMRDGKMHSRCEKKSRGTQSTRPHHELNSFLEAVSDKTENRTISTSRWHPKFNIHNSLVWQIFKTLSYFNQKIGFVSECMLFPFSCVWFESSREWETAQVSYCRSQPCWRKRSAVYYPRLGCVDIPQWATATDFPGPNSSHVEEHHL